MPTMRRLSFVHSFRRAIPAATAAALVLGLAACEPDLAPPFEPAGTGSIAGRLFFDADEDGLFTPTRGDTVLVGVPVEVRERGSDVVLDETETDAGGAFRFDDVRVGTHDVYVVATPETVGDVIFCENPVRASVYRDDEAFVTAIGTVACVIDISAAKDLDEDELVVVVGTVTAPPGVYRANNLYVQDETGGIQVFGNTTALDVGDVVEVRGLMDAFRTEIQIGGSPTVVKVGETSPPAAVVRVEGVSVGAFTTSTSGADADMTDESGTARLRLDQAAQARLLPSFEEGACYDITGIVGIFDNTTQLKPRYTSDVVEVACP
jgi:hypothetical protein